MSSASEHWNRNHRTPHHFVINHTLASTRIMAGACTSLELEESLREALSSSVSDWLKERRPTGKVTALPIPSRYGRWIAGLGGHQTPKGNDLENGRHVAAHMDARRSKRGLARRRGTSLTPGEVLSRERSRIFGVRHEDDWGTTGWIEVHQALLVVFWRESTRDKSWKYPWSTLTILVRSNAANYTNISPIPTS